MSIKLNDVVITAAVRTPIGSYKGSLRNIKADQLGSIVIKEVINQAIINPDDIDEVILGQVLTAGTGQNPRRAWPRGLARDGWGPVQKAR